MQNMILATPVLSDAATLSGTASSGDLGIGNLQKMSLKQVYRSISATMFIEADLGAAKAVNLIALIGHSGSSRSYARIRAASVYANLTTAPDYDSGLLPFRSHQTGYDAAWAAGVSDEQKGALGKNLFMKFFATQTYRYWRIDIVDPQASYIDIGRLYISNAFQPAINIEYGINEGINDPSRKTRTVSGELIPVERKKWRYVDFSLGYASKQEMFDRIFTIENTRGSTRDVLFVVDPDEKEHLQYRSYYGTMSNQPISNPMYSLFSKTFRIEEIPS